MAVYRQLAADIPADFGIPIFLIRALHNKLFYFLFYSLRCYFIFLDTIQVLTFVSPILFPFIGLALLNKRGRKFLVLTLLLMPLLFIFNPFKFGLGTKINIYRLYFMVLAFIGFIKANLLILDKHI